MTSFAMAIEGSTSVEELVDKPQSWVELMQAILAGGIDHDEIEYLCDQCAAQANLAVSGAWSWFAALPEMLSALTERQTTGGNDVPACLYEKFMQMAKAADVAEYRGPFEPQASPTYDQQNERYESLVRSAEILRTGKLACELIASRARALTTNDLHIVDLTIRRALKPVEALGTLRGVNYRTLCESIKEVTDPESAIPLLMLLLAALELEIPRHSPNPF